MSKKTPPELNVHWHTGAAVGKVVTPGEVCFAYNTNWLTKGFNLSPIKVPFKETLYRGRDQYFDFLPGFLCDGIPDQWGRKIMAGDFADRGVKLTPMNMLSWVGSRGIGALDYIPALAESDGFSQWDRVTTLQLVHEAQAVQRKEPPAAFEYLRKAGAAGGAFPKAIVAVLPDQTLLCGGGIVGAATDWLQARHGILKLDCEDLPGRPSTDGRMESATMEMARAAGIRTANCEIMADATGERRRHHLFIERFDVVAGSSRRLHVITLAGLLETYSLTYTDLLSTTRRLAQERSELIEATRRMIFNVRSGNGDDHGKNHSYLFDDVVGAWKLTPAYDMTLNHSEDRQFYGLFPQTFGSSPRLSALREVAAKFGIAADEFNSIDKSVAGTIADWEKYALAAGLTPADTQRAALIHQQIADSLEASGPAPRRTKRRPNY